uniref:VWFA domain-containing protein n=1 Tax=Hymenolepis diminuta TaxID=6216 RepID=A0A158QEB2_HYMDI
LICPPPKLLKASPCSTEGQMTEVYEVHEKRDCKCEKLIKSLQKACPCKPGKTIRGGCDQQTKTEEITEIGYRHADDDGRCEAVRKVTYEPCGDCSNKLERKELPCDYCKGKRDVVFITKFREEEGRRRCLVSEERKSEPCGCPKGAKKETVCNGHTNGIIVKTLRYRLQKGSCVPIVQLKRLPPPTCPPENETMVDRKTNVEEICDSESCQRYLLSREWQLDGCECRKVENKIAAGKCCCPKPEIKSSPCVGNQRSIQKFTYGLVNGQCLQHVANKVEACRSALYDSTRVYCDEVLGAKVYETSTYRQLADGTLETTQRRTIPVVCNETYVEGAGDCKSDPSTGLMVRTAVIMSSERERGCECSPPKARIISTACECIDIETGEMKKLKAGGFKEEIPCSPECAAQSELCGSPACKHKIQWYRLVHLNDSDSGGETIPKCRRELIREITSDCCCPPDSEVTRTCDINGGNAKWQLSQTKYMLEGGQCTPHEISWQESINCTEGLVDQKRGPKLPNGFQEVQLVFETLVGCKCIQGVKKLQCPWRCAEPTQHVYCDTTMGGESVLETTRYNLIGCTCQKQVQRKRSKITCPVYSEVVSRNCSTSTGEQTVIRRKMLQDGCSCKVIHEASLERCGCPPERRGISVCNPLTNEIETQVVKSLLFGGQCQEVTETEKKSIQCANKGVVKKPYLRCNKQTGHGEIVRTVWSVRDCICVQEEEILKRGQCNCDTPSKHTECDPDRGLRIHHLTSYTLDEASLDCVANITIEEEPFIYARSSITACPKTETIYTPCDPTKGERKIISVTYLPENCICKRQEEERIASCHCPLDKITFNEPVCDVLRQEFSNEGRVQEWRDDLNKCVDVVKRVSYPHVCSPRVQFITSSCKNGRMEIKKVTQESDPNSCKCIMNVTISKVDCRCPPKKVTIGNCDSGEETQVVAYLERDWDLKRGKCIFTNRYEEKLVCDCPTATEQTSCINGMMETRRIRHEPYKDRLGCKREEDIQRWSPTCLSDDKREEFGQCDPSTCRRSLKIYTHVYNASTCSCDRKLKEIKECSCCGCSEKKVSLSCHNGTEWIVRSEYYVPKVNGCGHTCRKRTTIAHQPIRCNKKSEESERCHNGTLLRIRKSFNLVDHQCKEDIQYLTRQSECEQPNERRTGSCDSLTCKRPVYEISYSRDKESCKCQPEQKLIGSEDCCCLPPSQPTKTCIGDCFVTIQILTNYDKNRKICIRTESVTRECPKETEPCGSAGDCLQRIRRTYFELENCRCKRRRSVRTRNCCCPQPTEGSLEEETPSCLPEENVLLHRRTVYNTVNGKCTNRTEIYREPVQCPPTEVNNSQSLIEQGECDKTTCLRKIRESKWVLSNCRCQQVYDERSESCCCNQFPPKVKEICRSDGTVLKETRYWKFTNGKCKPEVQIEALPMVECPPDQLHPVGPCDINTGRQPVEIVKYELKNCKCQPVNRTVKDRQCRCREDEIEYGVCDPETCLQNVSVTSFKREREICKAQSPLLKLRPCCCTKDKFEPKITRECNRKTGSVQETTTRYVFDSENHQCLPIKTVKIIPLEECEPGSSIKRGECNTTSGVAVDIMTKIFFDKDSCSCKKVENATERMCDCKHMPLLPPVTYCEEQKGELVTASFSFILKDNTCMNTTDKRREKIVCPPAQKSRGPCNSETCQATLKITEFIQKGCKCVEKHLNRQETCCCPEPSLTEECHENGSLLVQRHIDYKYNPKKKLCEPVSRVVRQPVECDLNRRVEISQHCDEQTCQLNSVVEVNVPKTCKCIPRRLTVVDNQKRCCCPPLKEISSCDADQGIILKKTTSYVLQNHSCIPQIVESEEHMRCPDPQMTFGPCDHKTKKREVTTKSYELEKCECKIRIKKSTQECGCPAPETVRGLCEEKTKTRVISKNFFRPINGTCVMDTKILRKEPCLCPPPTTSKRCEKGSWVTEKQTFRLAERNGITDCVREKDTEKVPVICPPTEKLSTGKCVPEIHRRKSTFRKFVVDPSTCECIPQMETKVDACDCHKKNRKETKCNEHELVINSFEYFAKSGDQNCSVKITQEVKPIECPTNREVVTTKSGGCVIKRENGTYRTEITRWNELTNCECLPREEVTEKLCECPKPKETSRCEDNSILVTGKIYFDRRGEACVEKQEITRRKINCEGNTRILDISTCEKSLNETGECFETIVVEKFFPENCKCLKKMLSFKRLSRAPPPRTTRKCDEKKHQWEISTTTFAVVPGENILFASGNVTVFDNKITSMKEGTFDAIVCPAKTIQEHCDDKTGIWTQTTTLYILDGCDCKKKEKVKVGKCVCPASEVWTSACENHFRTVMTKSHRQVEGECLPYETATRERCSCPSGSSQHIKCDENGQFTKCTLTYEFTPASKKCKTRKRCVSWKQPCPPSEQENVGTCGPETGYRKKIRETTYVLDKATCKCKPQVTIKLTGFCGCQHLNTRNITCENGVKASSVTTYNLIDGECIPEENIKRERIACPPPKEVIGSCDSDPNSPNTGLRTKTLHEFEIKGCECVPRVLNVTEICDCELRYGAKNETKCHGNEVVNAVTRWILKDGKCKPTLSITRSKLQCDLKDSPPKIVQGECHLGKDGVGRQNITYYELRPVNCRCERVPIKVETQKCSCPKASLKRKCLNNGTNLVEIRLKYTLKAKGVPICVKKRSEHPISPCSSKGGSKSWEIRGSCDPSTCQRVVQVYKQAPRGCECPTKKLTRMEVCCCPQPTVPTSTCKAKSNTIEVKFISSTLQSNMTIDGREYALQPYCAELNHTTIVPVSCTETKPMVVIGKCQNDDHQIVRVIGKRPVDCSCEEYELKRMRNRCGCPKTVKYTYGECINGRQIEKVLVFQPISSTVSINEGLLVNETNCQQVIASRRYIPCACAEKPRILRKCLQGNRLQIEEIEPFFNETLRSCQKNTTKKVYPTICPKPKKTISECGAEETGFTALETLTTWTPIDCECVPKITEKPFVCNCTARYPPRSRINCKDNLIREIVTTSFILKGQKCVPRKTKVDVEVVCSTELRSKVSPACDKDTHKRKVTWLKQVPQSCKCEWLPITSDEELKSRGLQSFEWCECPDAKKIDLKCTRVGPSQFSQEKTLLKYLRKGADCVPVEEKLLNNFTCQEGVQIHRSACDSLTGQLVEHRVIQQIDEKDCSCRRVAESSRQCACNCGGSSSAPLNSKTICHAASGVLETVEEVVELVNGCECRKSLKRTSHPVQCPSGILQQSTTECEMDDNGDSYRNITWITKYREGCRCLFKKHSRREICSCASQERNLTRCVDNARFELKTLRRVPTEENRCEEREVARKIVGVNCPKPRALSSVCNNKTGFALVSKEQPVIEMCVCKTRIQQFKIPCKCNPLEKLIYKSPCNTTTCLSLAVYAFEIPDASNNNTCLTKRVVKELKCCCPPPQKEQYCDSSSGMLRTRIQEFRLVNGECVPTVRISADLPVICPKSESAAIKILKTGKIRFLRRRTVRSKCACRNISETAFSKWKCPKQTQSRKCIKQDGADKYAWRTFVSLWKPFKGKVPTCKNHEVMINETPVSCSSEKIVESNCYFAPERNGFVKNVTTKSMRVIDCRCVPQDPVVKQVVCSCADPVVHTACNDEEGQITEIIIHFNASADSSRCVPHEIRREWKINCAPSNPIVRKTTPCKSGLFQRIYVMRKRDGCRCRTLTKRLSLPCECPKLNIETTCLEDGITQLTNTTTYTMEHLNAPCKREERITRNVVSCDSLPESELRAGRYYTIRQVDDRNPIRSVLHVYACGTGGSPCTRRVVKVTAVKAIKGCQCDVKREENIESCCCNANGQIGQSRNMHKSQWIECDSPDHPLSIRQLRSWHLVNGKCWPITLTSSKPLVCSDEEMITPLGVCVNGTQRFVVAKSIREGCHCKKVKSIEYRSCLCQTVSVAEVVFIVDESVSSRVPDYSRRVRDILQLTIRTFKESQNRNSSSSSFRFAVVKYSSDPSIAFNLDQYDDPAPMLNHVERLSYEGRLSNLGRALVLTKSEILPGVRAGIPTIIYIVSDGVNDMSEGAKELALELTSTGVKILSIAVGADSRGKAFLWGLTSKPHNRHFMIHSLKARNDDLTNWLINSLCIQACPESMQTRSVCSQDTGCLGQIYERKYQYKADVEKCVGVSVKRPYRCCCLEEPREEKRCVNGSLIVTKEMWKLSMESRSGLTVCQHFKFEQDLTGHLMKGCRPVEVHLGECSSDGTRIEVTIRRTLDNCECKARKEERCVDDDQKYLTIRQEVLNSDGVCNEEETVIKKQILCSEPKVFIGKCDPMTCKRQVTYFIERPEQCKCRKQFKITFEPCCCLDPKYGSREDECSGKGMKSITITSKEFDSHRRACVTKTERTYEPVDCPNDPVVTTSECGHFGNDVGANADPNLLFRRVEITSWNLENCECVPIRRWEFEACGCQEIDQPRVHECHEEEGILISYQQNFVLSIFGSNQTYNGSEAIGRRFTQLEQAKCKTVFAECPHDAVTRGPCIYENEVSRAYRNIETRSWRRNGCKCKQLPPKVTRELCGCRHQIWTQKRCYGRGSLILVSVIQEKLVSSPHGPRCKIDVQTRNETITCPASQIHYSNCTDGEMTVIIDLVSPRGCKCESTGLTRRLRCVEIAMNEGVEGLIGIKEQPGSLSNVTEKFHNFEELRERLSNLGLSDIQKPPDFVEEEVLPENIEEENDILRRIIKQEEENSRSDRDFVESVVLRKAIYRSELPETTKQTPAISIEVHTVEPKYLNEEEHYSDKSIGYIRMPSKSRSRKYKVRRNLSERIKGDFIPDETREEKYTSGKQKRGKLHPTHYKSMVLSSTTTVSEVYTSQPEITLEKSNTKLPVYHRNRSTSKEEKDTKFRGEINTPETTTYPQLLKPRRTRRRVPRSGLLEPLYYEGRTETEAAEMQQFTQISIDTELPGTNFSKSPKEKSYRIKPPKRIVLNAIECVDLLDSDKCAEKEKGPNSECDKPGQIRDELCRKTCHVCQGFPVNETEFTIEEGFTNDCLLLDVRYEAKYYLQTLKEAGLSKCKSACSSEPRCHGFDFYISLKERVHGSCVLGTVDRTALQIRLNTSNVKEGANAEDLNRMKAVRCIHFRKTRRPNTDAEEKPRLIYRSNCTCERMKSENPLAFTLSTSADKSVNGQQHCTKDIQNSERVTCQYPLTKEYGPQNEISGRNSTNLDPCVDVKPTEWCEEAARTGSCKQTSFRAVCGGTCGVCICDKTYENVGRCLPNGKMTVVRIETRFSPLHGRCTSIRHANVIPCEFCPAKPYVIVQSCNSKTESRLLIRVNPVQNLNNPAKCNLKISKKEVSCKDCMFDDGYSIEHSTISKCKKRKDGNYRLFLKTEYAVSVNGCCKLRKSYRSFPCLGCPKPKIGRSNCLGGWQMKTIVFFVRPSTGKFSDETKNIPPSTCFRHIISTKERCVSVKTYHDSNCTNFLGLIECQDFKNEGQCATNTRMALKLCAKQCNMC